MIWLIIITLYDCRVFDGVIGGRRFILLFCGKADVKVATKVWLFCSLKRGQGGHLLSWIDRSPGTPESRPQAVVSALDMSVRPALDQSDEAADRDRPMPKRLMEGATMYHYRPCFTRRTLHQFDLTGPALQSGVRSGWIGHRSLTI
jgi:hypothetical protein